MDLRVTLQSVVAVTVTPFDGYDRIDEAAYGAIIRRMVAGGVRTITANGNTGEFYALSASEVDHAIALAVSAADSADAVVIGGVGHDVGRAVAGARAVEAAGAAAIMVHQPVHPYQSAAGWLAYHQTIADAVPRLGVLCYVRDPRISGELLARLADECPNVIAVKYAVPDVLRFARVIEAVPPGRLTWICGLAELWAPFFHLAGATGFTSGLATIAPALSVALHRHLAAGDTAEAMALWAQLRPLEELRAADASADNVSVVKGALAGLGLCAPSVRPPSSVLSEVDGAAVRKIVSGWALQDLAAAASASAA
jgi:4-hydroxy-tetrahydrodipicolinate synthase